jgi:hypothetical protein
MLFFLKNTHSVEKLRNLRSNLGRGQIPGIAARLSPPGITFTAFLVNDSLCRGIMGIIHRLTRISRWNCEIRRRRTKPVGGYNKLREMLKILLIAAKLKALSFVGLPLLVIVFFLFAIGTMESNSISAAVAANMAEKSVKHACIAMFALNGIVLAFHFIILQSIV